MFDIIKHGRKTTSSNMNLQQLEYILSVDQHRHFTRAADACFVTKATLSMMVKKLESELNITIFDRSKHPVVPTEAGLIVIKKAREVLLAVKALEDTVKQVENEVKGELRIGIIPTLAPYLLHLFLPRLLENYPELHIKLKEMHTEHIVDALRRDQLDVGLLATPYEAEDLKAHPLFYEKLLVFVSDKDPAIGHDYVLPSEIDLERLWLLEEEHCLRSQIMNLCSLKKKSFDTNALEFEAGSIETLLRMVEMNSGITIIPELTAATFTESRRKQLRNFKFPEPVREISMVTYRHFIKARLLNALETEIKAAVLPMLSTKDKGQKIVKM